MISTGSAVRGKGTRIALVYMGRRGGICHCTYELARALSKLTPVTCYISNYNELLDNFRALPCEVRTFNTYTGYGSLIWSLITRGGPRKVAARVRADAPDVVINSCNEPWKGIIQKKVHKRFPTAEIVHDVENHPDRWAWQCFLMDRFLTGVTDIYIALSAYSHRLLKARFPDAGHIESRHGVIHTRVVPKVDSVVENRNRLLFFGRIERYKGLEMMVDAFGIARGRNPELQLSVMGDGPIDEAMKRRILSLGINLRNEWIPSRDLEEIFASHGIMVMPYLSATQSGIAMTAMANGMPGVATSAGALPEQVIHGRNGLIVPPGDAEAFAQAIVDISTNAGLARQMSEQALEIAREIYTWDRIAAQLLADLHGLLIGREEQRWTAAA